MPPKSIFYNGYTYTKHTRQPYYYSTKSRPHRSLHRQMWFDAYGEIPEGCDIHHKNLNSFDNRVENLEAKPSGKHISDHGKDRFKVYPEKLLRLAEIGREFAKEWHSSSEGMEWHKQHAKNIGLGKFDYGYCACEECGKDYHKKTLRSRFCSNSCKSAWRRHNKPDMKMANCPTCGDEFTTLKYLPNTYCSLKCKPVPNPYGSRGKKGYLIKPHTLKQ